MIKSSIDIIREYHEKYPQLCHASNILKKYDDGQKVNQLMQIADKYAIYLEENLKLVGFTDASIKKRVRLLNNYYNFIHTNNLDNLYSSIKLFFIINNQFFYFRFTSRI